jgi:hypothetical protein
MFTALINLVVDFLFVDILFAPTTDSNNRNKVSKEMPSLSPQPSVIEERPPTNTATLVSLKNRSTLNNVKRLTLATMKSSNLQLETTRVLPGATTDAHTLAKLSVKEILSDRVTALKNTLLHREYQRQTSIIKHKSRVKSISVPGMDMEEQFAELTADIAEQRKLLKRSQQEKFDEMWG